MKAARYILLSFLVLLVACQPEEEPRVPPTVFDPSVNATNEAVLNATARAETGLPPEATATSPPTGPTLPPTFTPDIPPTNPPSRTPQATSTPEAFGAGGVIHYIFNGDSIMALSPDGSGERVIEIFSAGQRISDLTLSPDGELLAYVAPGNGSAREIFISRRDGSYRQQVTCLGYSEVMSPAWSADGQRIAFFAAQSPDMPMSIYSASWVGAVECPTGNDQRVLIENITQSVGNIAYHPDGTRLFYSAEEIYAFELSSGTTSAALTTSIGFGPDRNLVFSPTDPNALAYIRAERNIDEFTTAGGLVIIDVEDTLLPPVPDTELRASAQHIAWSNDGESIVVSEGGILFVYNLPSRQANNIVTNTAFQPQGVFSPSDNFIAYIDADPNNPELPQIFAVDLDGDSQQLTFHSDGTITDIIWADEISP